MKGATSFTRFSKGGPASGPAAPVMKLPAGSRPSVSNGQLLVSSGLHELDEILGGGLAVGTIILVEEDQHTAFNSALLKYFISEGMSIDQGIAVASRDTEMKDIMRKLPKDITFPDAPTDNSNSNTNQAPPDEEDKPKQQSANLKIAWQYEKYIKDQSSSSGGSFNTHGSSTPANRVQPYCHSYDFGHHIKEEQLIRPNLFHLAVEGNNLYRDLYNKISDVIVADYKSEIEDKLKQRSILRVAIESLGSPLWSNTNENGDKELLLFLHALRGLLRYSLGVCMITFPHYLYSSSFVKKVENLCDTVVRFESFDGLGVKVPDAFSEFDGMFLVRKLPALNSIAPHVPETVKFVFRMGRRKLHLEIPHLGPEESRTTKQDASSSLLCLPGPPNKGNPLDF